MRLSNVFSGRPNDYDRNATEVGVWIDLSTLGPHLLTTRLTYTVPTGRKSRITGNSSTVRRITAGAPVGVYQTILYFATSLNVVFERTSLNNAVGTEFVDHAPANPVMVAGIILRWATTDSSTGGSVAYAIGSTITEFDA